MSFNQYTEYQQKEAGWYQGAHNDFMINLVISTFRVLDYQNKQKETNHGKNGQPFDLF